MRNFKIYLLLFFLLHLTVFVRATHIRAGEIIATRLSPFTYRFTLTIYANSLSAADNPDATMDFGDNTGATVGRNSKTYIGNNTFKNIYIFTHTFSGAGDYKVGYTEVNRNAEIKNIGNSVGTPFYVETFVVISAQTGDNTPIVTQVPPIDKAVVGKIFTHNAGAYDADGDSISYLMVIPKANAGAIVGGYSTPPYTNSLTLNPITGDLVWNTPTTAGLYNIAFIIEEWKKGITGIWSRIGYITRDMQIRVINSPNNPPVLKLPNDTCIVVGGNLNKPIIATDPDHNQIVITSYPLVPPFPVNYFGISNPQNSPAQGTFSWTPNCFDIREQPYDFTFRAEDRPIDDTMRLTDIRTWQVKVKGPAPQGLSAYSSGNTMVLNWSPYSCLNADSMYIYRKDCSTLTNTDPCREGISGYPGYTIAGVVSVFTNTFTDDNHGKGLKRGTEYCYMIQAKFPLPKLGESYASNQVCQGLLLDAPMISLVSVNSTSASGSITVEWIPPVNPPFAGPYTYNLYRTVGIDSNYYGLIASNVTSPYMDNNINTQLDGYTYKVELVGGAMSDPASSVFLKIKTASSALKLHWDQVAANTNDSIDVYRSTNRSPYVFLKRIYGDPKAYKDEGLKNCDTVCYYLKIYNSFCDVNVISPEYTSLSQMTCGIPIDSFPPNVPELSVIGCGNNLTVFQNILNWTNVRDPLCGNIKSYNIYYAAYDDDTLKFYTATDNNTFQYTDIDSISTAGCYAVSAVNTYDVESGLSNKVCVDDCIYYELPNLITPNGDSLNDIFHAFPIPRGVQIVKFAAYNGWGKLVFSRSDNINIYWSGISNDGTYLSDGVYFFSAEIKYFRRVHRDDELKTIKGWVQIFNQTNGAINNNLMK